MGRRGTRKHGSLYGKRYGRLVVTADPAVSSIGEYLVDAQCDCGQSLTTKRYSITYGYTSSCGCMLSESRARNGRLNFVDITGVKFGRLTAIERVTTPGECKAPRWLFRCECGIPKVIGGNYVSSGQIVSCGCASGTIVRSEAIREKRRAYIKKRRASDVRFLLSMRFSNAIRKSLIKTKSKKIARWETTFGYTSADLVTHLTSTMPRGYTWADYASGILHIDHKRPLSSFSFKKGTDAEFIAAWALSNLQLMTAQDNMHKHDKWDGRL